MLRLVVGLGNPGRQYERTRHNIGFRLADRLIGVESPSWKDFNGLGVFSRAEDLWVAKPMTFMNESGQFVRAFMDYYHIAHGEVLIVYDEIALELGKIRIRAQGSDGGQKGMLSILQSLGTQKIPRLRIGIGPQPEKMDAADFVLAAFRAFEEKDLDLALNTSVDAVKTICTEGLEAAMNRFNSN